MNSDNKFKLPPIISPRYTDDGTPWCRQECPSRAGSYCSYNTYTLHWSVCLPAIRKYRDFSIKNEQRLKVLEENYFRMEKSFEMCLILAISKENLDQDMKIDVVCEMISQSKGFRIHKDEAKAWLMSKNLIK